MIQKVKTALRISGTAFDDEVADLIAAAKADLMGAGVVVDDSDPLHQQAIVCFCKSRYGYEDPQQADRFWKSYEAHKIHLAIVAGVSGNKPEPVPEPEKDPLSLVDLSKLESEGKLTLGYGDESEVYGFRKVEGGYELTMPDGSRKVFFDTVDEDSGGDSP